MHYLVNQLQDPELTLCGKVPGDHTPVTRLINDVDCEACLDKFDDLRRRWARKDWPGKKIPRE